LTTAISNTFLKSTFDCFLIFANVPTFRLVCSRPCTTKVLHYYSTHASSRRQ